MLRTSPTLRRTSWAVSGLLTAVMLAGCGSTTEPGGNAEDPTDSAASTTPDTDPTPTASPSAPATTDAGSPGAGGLAGRLLTAADLAGTGTGWSQGRTGSAGAEPFGICQQFDLATIGATKVLQRDFTAEDGTTAAEQLARFPDAMTATRVGKVIESWRADCRKHAGREHARLKVGPAYRVDVDGGTATWYLTSWVPQDDAIDGHFQALGAVVSDTQIALVRIDHDGQDHEQTPEDDPMVTALRAAAQRM